MEIGISWGLAWRGNHLHAGERSLLFSAVLASASLPKWFGRYCYCGGVYYWFIVDLSSTN